MFFVEIAVRAVQNDRPVRLSKLTLPTPDNHVSNLSFPDSVRQSIETISLQNVLFIGLTTKHIKKFQEFSKNIQQFTIISESEVSTLSQLIDRTSSVDLIVLNYSSDSYDPIKILIRFRRLGYVGFAVLISHQLYPSTNDKFLSCGGDAILLSPITSPCLERVLIGKCVQNLFF